MKLKNSKKLVNDYQVWRLLISESDKLIIESRDQESKQAYFSCFDLNKKNYDFKNFQFEEKTWIGIEEIVDDLIILHSFSKPDLPMHKEIIVFSLTEKKVLWTNKEYAYSFQHKEVVYCFKQKFEGWDYYKLRLISGEFIGEAESNNEEIQKLKIEADSKDKYSDYKFPQKFDQKITPTEVNQLILEYTKSIELVGDIEYTQFNKLLFFNMYQKKKNNQLTNIFFTVNLESKKEILKETLIQNANAFVPDSFFVYKNTLILLHEKNSVFLFEIK